MNAPGGFVKFLAWLAVLPAVLLGQGPSKVDFGRDVQPVFKSNCYSCHGPSQQNSGLRLDRRHAVIPNRVGANGALIVPGSSAESRLYVKLIGTQAGVQMPPTGPLAPEQIAIIKAWIDQGAEWADELSGDTPSTPPDPKATRIMEALRNGDRQQFKALLRENPKAVNLKGPGGSGPLMYAALYGDSESVRLLLKGGADPKLRNEAGATALMWATDDLEKTRMLLDHGADPNVFSDDGITPLMIAAGRYGSGPVVRALIEHGAKASAKSPDSSRSPLSEAARAGDEGVMRMLIEHGADPKSPPRPFAAAVVSGCGACVDLLLASADKAALNRGLAVAVTRSNMPVVNMLLDRGADVNSISPQFRVSTLAEAALSDTASTELVKSLLDHGGDINRKTENAETVLDLAQKLGDRAVVELLKTAGAKSGELPVKTEPKPMPAESARAAVERSIPLLQRSDVTFVRKSGCVSCHNNSLTEMTVAIARTKGLRVDDEIERAQLKTIGSYIDSWRERALQGIGIPGNQDTLSYLLLGMAAENYPADAATDAFARFLRNRQSADGRWWIGSSRAPLESSDVETTAVCLRVIQVYGPKSRRAEYDKSVLLAAAWLAKAEPKTSEDRVFQLLGLWWAQADKALVSRAAQGLIAEQRSDGGWAQIPSLSSDAYATGQALVALQQSGAFQVSAPAYKRGIEWLLKKQLGDGSWHVASRSLPFQPYFESDFPHGRDQWISAAATNWATMALALSLEPAAIRAAK
jgi:ankyrin repeat protein